MVLITNSNPTKSIWVLSEDIIRSWKRFKLEWTHIPIIAGLSIAEELAASDKVGQLAHGINLLSIFFKTPKISSEDARVTITSQQNQSVGKRFLYRLNVSLIILKRMGMDVRKQEE